LLILGIESSCDDTGVALVRDGKDVVGNFVSSQIEIHRPYGGVVPEIASRAHIENLLPLVQQCINETGSAAADIDAIAVTHTPGLAGCLLVGVSFAKSYAYALNKPLIGIHHLEAHAYTIALDVEEKDRPPFPHLALLVSGGHTTLYQVESWTSLVPLGSTKDDAAGEAFDKVAKVLNLGFPGGPAIQKRAEGYTGERIPFPRPMLHQGYDFSFSGLKTAIINHIRQEEPTEEEITKTTASFQDAVVDVLVTKTLRAAEDFGLSHITLVGGVSANQALRDELTRRAQQKGYSVYLPAKKYSMDNGAMIAGLAYHYLQQGRIADLTLNANP
jgi:N6-L-threonylcarbamoyladenine synthase